MSVLDDLLNRGLIESVEPDDASAAKWLEDAARHIDAAQRIADIDPSGAYVLAYDAARKSVAIALLATGHRIRSRPGSHQALTRYANHLAAQGNQLSNDWDRLRRNRNRSEYGSRTFGQAEVAEAINIARAIHSAIAKFV